MFDDQKFPCPCCGYCVHEHEPGFHQVCPICGWEDDLSQLRFVAMPGSSNTVSLIDAQQNYPVFDYSTLDFAIFGPNRPQKQGKPLIVLERFMPNPL